MKCRDVIPDKVPRHFDVESSLAPDLKHFIREELPGLLDADD